MLTDLGVLKSSQPLILQTLTRSRNALQDPEYLAEILRTSIHPACRRFCVNSSRGKPEEHHHAGIALMTPDQNHFGTGRSHPHGPARKGHLAQSAFPQNADASSYKRRTTENSITAVWNHPTKPNEGNQALKSMPLSKVVNKRSVLDFPAAYAQQQCSAVLAKKTQAVIAMQRCSPPKGLKEALRKVKLNKRSQPTGQGRPRRDPVVQYGECFKLIPIAKHVAGEARRDASRQFVTHRGGGGTRTVRSSFEFNRAAQDASTIKNYLDLHSVPRKRPI